MHTSANQVDEESDEVIQRRQRIGLRLLWVFTLAYAGFIGLCTFANTWVSETRLSGIPLTVAFGVGLILLSIGVAIAYGVWNRQAR